MPCIAVVENMCYFDADGKRYFPFGKGSGTQACDAFSICFWSSFVSRVQNFKMLYTVQLIEQYMILYLSINIIHALEGMSKSSIPFNLNIN